MAFQYIDGVAVVYRAHCGRPVSSAILTIVERQEPDPEPDDDFI
jgi:hypothetical protein